MFRTQAMAGIARHAVFFACSVPVFCMAAGGSIRFQGAIVESACTVSAAHSGFSQAMLRRLDASRSSARVDSGPMRLNMRCNANQSVDLSVESRASAGADAAGIGTAVDVVLSRVGKDLRAGDAIPLALAGKKDNGIDIATALRKVAGSGATADGRMDSAILVSVNYR